MNKILLSLLLVSVLTVPVSTIGPTPKAFWGVTFGLMVDFVPPFGNCYTDVEMGVEAIINIIKSGEIGLIQLLPILQAATTIVPDCNSTYVMAIDVYYQILNTMKEPMDQLLEDIVATLIINIPLLIGNFQDAIRAIEKEDFFTLGHSAADVIFHLLDAYRFSWPRKDREDYLTGALDGLYHGGYDVYTIMSCPTSVIDEINAWKVKFDFLTHLTNILNIFLGCLMTGFEINDYIMSWIHEFADGVLWPTIKENWEDIISFGLRAGYNAWIKDYYALAYNAAGVFNGFFPAPTGSPI